MSIRIIYLAISLSLFINVNTAYAFQSVEGLGNRNSYCKTLYQSVSPHISEICFNYDYKFKLSALMGEPTEYSTIRWYLPENLSRSIKFRTSVLRENNISANEILNNAEFKKWLGYLSIDGQLFIRFPEFGAASRLVLQTEPGYIKGANKEWSFNIPGSPSWNKLFLRTERYECSDLTNAYQNAGSSNGKDYVDMLEPYHFLTKVQAQSFIKSYSKGEVTHSFCNVKVYGHHDLKHAIYKIIEEKKCPNGECPKDENEQVAEKKKPKVKDWFAKKKTKSTDKAEDKFAGIDSKQDILKKSSKNGVTDWFKVDKLTKQAEIKRQTILEEERKALEEQRKSIEEKITDMYGEILTKSSNGQVYLVNRPFDKKLNRKGGILFVSADLERVNKNYPLFLGWTYSRTHKNELILSEKVLFGYSGGCNGEYGDPVTTYIFNSNDFSFKRNSTKKPYYQGTVCLSSG